MIYSRKIINAFCAFAKVLMLALLGFCLIKIFKLYDDNEALLIYGGFSDIEVFVRSQKSLEISDEGCFPVECELTVLFFSFFLSSSFLNFFFF